MNKPKPLPDAVDLPAVGVIIRKPEIWESPEGKKYWRARVRTTDGTEGYIYHDARCQARWNPGEWPYERRCTRTAGVARIVNGEELSLCGLHVQDFDNGREWTQV